MRKGKRQRNLSLPESEPPRQDLLGKVFSTKQLPSLSGTPTSFELFICQETICFLTV